MHLIQSRNSCLLTIVPILLLARNGQNAYIRLFISVFFFMVNIEKPNKFRIETLFACMYIFLLMMSIVWMRLLLPFSDTHTHTGDHSQSHKCDNKLKQWSVRITFTIGNTYDPYIFTLVVVVIFLSRFHLKYSGSEHNLSMLRTALLASNSLFRDTFNRYIPTYLLLS